MAHRRLVGAYFLLQGLCAATWTAQIPAMQQRLELDHAQLGNVLLALSAGVLCAMPVASAVLLRCSGTWALACGALAHAGTLASLSLVHGVVASMACLFAFGAANTVVQVAVNQHALAVQRRAGRSVMAGYHGCWSVAAVVAALATYASGRLGVPPAVHLRAVAGLAACVVVGLVVGRGASPRPSAEANATLTRRAAEPLGNGDEQGGPGSAGDAGGGHALKKPGRARRRLAALGATTAGAMAVEAVAFDWGAVLYRQALHGDAAGAGLGYAALMLGMTVGRVTADRLAERLGAQNLLASLATTVSVGGFVAAGAARPMVVSGALFVMGLGLSALVPLLLAGCDGVPGVAPARALASVSAAGAVGALAGPTALGWTAQLVGLGPAFAGAAAAALAVGLGGHRLLAGRRPHPLEPRGRGAGTAPGRSDVHRALSAVE